MIRNWLMLTVLLVPVCVLGADAPVTAPPEVAGMRALFNGKDLTGWDGDPRMWSVKEGVIHGETTDEKQDCPDGRDHRGGKVELTTHETVPEAVNHADHGIKGIEQSEIIRDHRTAEAHWSGARNGGGPDAV